VQLFSRIDSHHSGSVSVDEFVAVFLPQAQAAAAAAAVSASASGSAAGPIGQSFRSPRGAVPPADPEVELRNFFALLDADGNGRLDYREFLVGMCVAMWIDDIEHVLPVCRLCVSIYSQVYRQ
jgi:Ca2+-binding EF-hand superfamily protein